jgi:hypothetical protein
MTSARRRIALAFACWLASGSALGCSGAGGPSPDAGADATSPDAGTPDAAGVLREASGGDAADSGTLPDSPTLDAGLDAPTPEPSLVTLTVSASASGDASSPAALVPPFSPDVHDYSVRCVAGTNQMTVSMTAANGSESLLIQPTPSPARAQQTLSVSVTENQAIVAAATNEAATVEYWVRCLPHDFPLLQWTPHAQAGALTPGYYLIGTALPTTSGCYAMVLDPDGVPVWYAKSQPSPPLGWCIFDVDDVVSGAVSFDAVVDSPAEFEIHQLSPLATTTIAPAGLLNVDLHELRVLANGDYLVISSPLQSGVDLTGLEVPLPDGGVETLGATQPILACNLVEFAPDGTVVWTWTATDHFDVVADSVTPQLLPIGSTGTLVVDPIHCNSIDVDPTSGNLLVSARQMNSIFYVERSTGQVLWKMGGARASKDGAAYVAVADPFVQQHDPRFQPDWSSNCNGGSGHISLFDDQTGELSPARALVYDVAVGAGTDGTCSDGGTAAGTATVAWQRAGTGPSLAMGSFRILPDGSRVVGWGDIPGAGFTEVDLDGNDLADLTFSDGNTTYRAIKVPLGTFDLSVLRSTAGLP